MDNVLKDMIDKIVDLEIEQINTMIPGKIHKFYHERMRADVIILAKQKLEGEEVEIPIILECPVIFPRVRDFYIRVPYKPGDVVYVGFSKHALDELLINGTSNGTKFNRMFSLDDAVVIGGLATETDSSINPNFVDDIVLESTKSGTLIKITPDGNIDIDKAKDVSCNCVNLNATASASTIIKSPTIKLDGKVHITGTLLVDEQTTIKSGADVSGLVKAGSVTAGSEGSMMTMKSGTIKAKELIVSGDVITGELSLNSHAHSCGQGSTGGPV